VLLPVPFSYFSLTGIGVRHGREVVNPLFRNMEMPGSAHSSTATSPTKSSAPAFTASTAASVAASAAASERV
jgi:hypothetical protein